MPVGAKATASSVDTYWGGWPSRVIDGNGGGGDWGTGTCALTDYSKPPPTWIMVDLLSEWRLSVVRLTGRADCCPDQSQGLTIRVGHRWYNTIPQ